MASPKTVRCREITGELSDPIPVDWLTDRVSVYGIIVQNNYVLLVPQWDGYDFPGGGKDPGETLPETLVRECREETGLTIQQDSLVSVSEDFFIHPYKRDYHHTILIYYSATVIGGTLSSSGFDEHEQQYAQKAEWIPLQTVPNLSFYNPVDSVTLIQYVQSQVA